MISIQTYDEFDLFISRLKSLLTPQRTAAGKPSTRQVKKFLVQFEDASSKDQTSNNKAVRVLLFMIAHCMLIMMDLLYTPAGLTICTR